MGFTGRGRGTESLTEYCRLSTTAGVPCPMDSVRTSDLSTQTINLVICPLTAENIPVISISALIWI